MWVYQYNYYCLSQSHLLGGTFTLLIVHPVLSCALPQKSGLHTVQKIISCNSMLKCSRARC